MRQQNACTRESHECAKLDPDRRLVNRRDWPGTDLVLFECPACFSTLAIELPESSVAEVAA